MPGHAKTVSTIIEPLSRVPSSNPTTVITGIRALLVTWRQTMFFSASPLARAVEYNLRS